LITKLLNKYLSNIDNPKDSTC